MRHSIYVETEVRVRDVLMELSDADLIEICKERGVTPLTPPKQDDAALGDALDQASFEFDGWLHDLREAFLSRDARHFAVLISRGEGRWRGLAVQARAIERVTA